MFWGITLEHGNIYSQIVEEPFHISMAALGFENLSSDATTVMVESEKADFAICTLQAGKIPQQPLDLNFTEGEEVKFFLEGNGGVVHLTGYLLEKPREYEFDEDDLEGLLSSEENATSSEDDQGEVEAKESDSEEENTSEDETAVSIQTEKVKINKGIDKDSESRESDDGDLEADVSWQNALIGEMDESLGTSDSDDDDWDPQKNSKKLLKTRKPNITVISSKKKKQPLSQTLVDLMGIDDNDDSEESSDEDWAPSTDKDKNEVPMTTDDNGVSESINVCSKYNGDVLN